MCWCTVGWQVRSWKVFLSFFYFYQLSRYYRRDIIFPVLLFGSCERGKQKCRDSVTFHKLTARITRFVNTVIGDTSDCEIGLHVYRKDTKNRTHCNTGRELNKHLLSTSELWVCELRCTQLTSLVQRKLLLNLKLVCKELWFFQRSTFVLTFTGPSEWVLSPTFWINLK